MTEGWATRPILKVLERKPVISEERRIMAEEVMCRNPIANHVILFNLIADRGRLTSLDLLRMIKAYEEMSLAYGSACVFSVSELLYAAEIDKIPRSKFYKRAGLNYADGVGVGW